MLNEPGSQAMFTQAMFTDQKRVRSDIRLKTDVIRVGQLDNGLPLYRFRYLWSSDIYVGVLAHEVLPVVPYAVIVGEDGFMRVNYDMLDTRLMTWEEWQKISASASQELNSAPVDNNPLIAELRTKGVDLLGF
jgi:hypothetical protein